MKQRITLFKYEYSFEKVKLLYSMNFCTVCHAPLELYRKNSKIWDTSNNCHNCPKIGKVWCNIALMHSKAADAMASSVDPDQTASSEAV